MWIRSIVGSEMGKKEGEVFVAAEMATGKKDAAVFAAAQRLEVAESTVWNAIRVWKPAPAPPLTESRFTAMIADNLAIAERSGNEPAIKRLRRMLCDAHSLFEHISSKSK